VTADPDKIHVVGEARDKAVLRRKRGDLDKRDTRRQNAIPEKLYVNIEGGDGSMIDGLTRAEKMLHLPE
jgi:hypothetical protein